MRQVVDEVDARHYVEPELREAIGAYENAKQHLAEVIQRVQSECGHECVGETEERDQHEMWRICLRCGFRVASYRYWYWDGFRPGGKELQDSKTRRVVTISHEDFNELRRSL